MRRGPDNELRIEEPVTVREEELLTRTINSTVSAFYSEDITTEEVMRAVEASGTLDFWNDPAEDVYDEDDGDPI